MSLGSRISIHPFCYLDASGGLEIGDDVSIAHGVTILSTEHNFVELGIPIRDQGTVSLPTKVGSNVWVGAGVKVLAGVEIGEGSVIAAGAVVTKDVPSFCVAAGVPAKVIRRREP